MVAAKVAKWAEVKAPGIGMTRGGAATVAATAVSVLGAVGSILAAAETWPGLKPDVKQKMIVVGSAVSAILSVISSATGYVTPAPRAAGSDGSSDALLHP